MLLSRFRPSALFLGLALALVSLKPATCQEAPPLPEGEDELVGIQWPNFPLSRILVYYETMTGTNVIQDAAIQTATLTIQTTKKMPKDEAARFIEKSLLLNGFALIPAGEDTLKIVAVPKEQGQARSEGLPIYHEVGALPQSDQLVAYVMTFDHLGSERAAETLNAVFPSHGYGTIVPFPRTSSVLITDNTSVIRRYAELQPYIDQPAKDLDIGMRVFALERADATEVAEAIVELLDLGEAPGSRGSAQTGGQAPWRAVPANAGAVSPGVITAQLQGQSPDEEQVEPKVRPDVRTNSVLAVASPQDLEYIGTLVEFLDAPAAPRRFLKRDLHYLPVSTFLPIVRDALMPGIPAEGSGGSISGGEASANANQNQGGTGSLGRSGGGGLGSGLGSGSSGIGGGLGGAQFSTDVGPQSLVVGKTLLIGDNVHNRLIASGPQEHMDIIDELLDDMDRKPRQIQISAVIAQLTLGDDLEFGADVFRAIERNDPNNQFAGVVRNRDGSVLDIDTLSAIDAFLPAAQGLTLYGQIDGLLNTYVSALQSTNRFKVLARPTVYTLNNRWAAISTGQRIAVPSSTLSTVDPDNFNQAVRSSISFEEVLLQVRVLPLINSDDQVTLQIEQNNDDIVGSQNISGNDIPTIGTQQLYTTVIVPDGGTVLLGGLISEDDRKTDTGLPVFVGLPLVGPLFGNADHEKSRQELLIFIQPKIVETEVDLANAQADVAARSELADEALGFAAPKVTAEVKPRGGLLRRLLGRKGKEEERPVVQPGTVELRPVVEE